MKFNSQMKPQMWNIHPYIVAYNAWRMGLDRPPVAYWPFWEGAGDKVFDIMRNNTGTLTNGPTWDVGEHGRALDFDGATNYINIDDSLSVLSTTTKGTWVAWVKPAQVGISAVPLSFGDTNADEFIYLHQQANNTCLSFVSDGGVDQWRIRTVAAVFFADTWVQVILVQDGVEPAIYIDGVKMAVVFDVAVDKASWFFELTGIDNGRIGTLNTDLFGNIAYFNGLIDNVQIYDYALTLSQVQQLYSNPFGLIQQPNMGALWAYYEAVAGNPWWYYNMIGRQ